MCRMELDPCGHYARPDVLELKINEKWKMITYVIYKNKLKQFKTLFWKN